MNKKTEKKLIGFHNLKVLLLIITNIALAVLELIGLASLISAGSETIMGQLGSAVCVLLIMLQAIVLSIFIGCKYFVEGDGK